MTHLQELITAFPRIFKGEPPVIPGYVNAGWHPLLMRLCSGIDALLSDQEAEQCEVMQVKEKFWRAALLCPPGTGRANFDGHHCT